MNPGSSITTSSFIGTVGSDMSSSSTAASLTFIPGLLTSLTISFEGKVVNTTSPMIITFIAGNEIPQNGAVTILFPSDLKWKRDISSTHYIPLNGVLSCYGKTANTNNATI